MTGREKIEAALSEEGSSEVPVVISYPEFFVRDHWEQLTDKPWWYTQSPDLEHQIQWREDVYDTIPIDWYEIPFTYDYSDEDRENIFIEQAGADIYKTDRRTGSKEKLVKPHWSDVVHDLSSNPDLAPQSSSEIDAAIPLPPVNEIDNIHSYGKNALSSRLLDRFGKSMLPILELTPPLADVYFTWGYETAMILISTRPDLVAHACNRFLKQALYNLRKASHLGAGAIWMEDSFTDMIRPEDFLQFNVTYLQRIMNEIRALGMNSVYYYTGNPYGKWDHILSIGADALAFEESKKGFLVDIEDVVKRTNGRCAVFGNLDVIHILAAADTEQLENEIRRQIAAGRDNNNRFVMSVGSPVTPATTVERLKQYIDLVHKLGA